MNIIIGNQKGGCGKTTHCILLANYFSLIKNENVAILEMDIQKSMIKMRNDNEKDKNFKFHYDIIHKNIDDFENFISTLKSLKDTYIFIDLPAGINNDSLLSIYKNTEVVIIPFSYDKITFNSTHIFMQIINHINPNIKIIFLPNRLKASVKYDIKTKVNKEFEKNGIIVDEIPDRISLQRINTFSINNELFYLIDKPYYKIHKNIKI